MDRAVRDYPELRPEIATALQTITGELRTAAATAGESRESPYRVQSVAPVALYFRAAPDERAVYVTRARVYLKRSR